MTDLAPLHAALARVVVVDRPLDQVLGEIVGIARRAIPGSEAASITLIRRDHGYTAAFDGQLALDAAEMQFRSGYGPSTDSARAGQVMLVRDLRVEDRWADFASQAVPRGVLSALSVPLPFQNAVIGALDHYSTRLDAFGEDDIELARDVADWVAVAVNNASQAAKTLEELSDMRAAMASRAVIEQAKGMLMERFKVTDDDAFRLLTRASQHTNTKLRSIADTLVRTGELVGRYADRV